MTSRFTTSSLDDMAIRNEIGQWLENSQLDQSAIRNENRRPTIRNESTLHGSKIVLFCIFQGTLYNYSDASADYKSELTLQHRPGFNLADDKLWYTVHNVCSVWEHFYENIDLLDDSELFR